VRVSKTANKQRERIEIRFDTISSELFFCEIIRVLRVAEMVASITKEREREIFSIGILHRHSAHSHIKMRHHRKPTARFNAFSGLEMLPMYGAILIVYDANSTFDPKFDLRKA
tara:strand:+ start:1828 stop:2166 length:339 start_codon:yes stop_codon:yes gene_type:complete